MIDHNYEKANRLMLQSYISLMISRPVVTAFRNRLVYCQNNKQSNGGISRSIRDRYLQG